MSELRLWLTGPEPRRYFLVPGDLELPPGDLEVRSLQGTTGRWEAGALVEHEVDADRAAAHVNAGWEDLLGRVRDTWRDLSGAPPADTPPDLGAWLGVTPGEAFTDPEKSRRVRRTLIERAGRLLGATMSDDEVDVIDGRLEKLGDTLVRDVGRLRTGTERLGERIDEKRPDVEATIEQTSETLAELGREAIARLRAFGRTRRDEPKPRDDV